MTALYARVSTGVQDTANQGFELRNYCESHNIQVDKYVEETVSGVKTPKLRKLGDLVDQLNPGDTIMCTEISRLSRSIMELYSFMADMMEREIHVVAIKQNFELKDDITSKVLIFALGLCAEIERTMISERTKMALEKKKAEGVKLGRRPGTKNKRVKLTDKEPAIRILLNEGQSYSSIARLLRVDRTTLMRYIASRCPDIEAARINHSHRCPGLSPEASAAVAACVANETASVQFNPI